MQDDLRELFFPGSIALVGIPRGLKSGKVFLLGLLDQGFAGPIYLIHPTAADIDGYKAYPSLLNVPGPVDMAIVMSPKETILTVLAECSQKKVKAVILYTSGFSELDSERGRSDEARMKNLARDGGFRILGPNCMGIYSPGSLLAPFPGMPKTMGDLGFLSQSGSLVNLFVNLCSGKGMFFSHVVSYGNSADVGLSDLIEWMARDDHTRLICSYCEGMQDPRRLIDVLKEATSRKPLIMWKVGLTEAGSRAAASHTGSLTGRKDLWTSMFRQFHILDVYDIEEMLDLVMAFYHLRPRVKGRVVIVSGPGGPAVSAADAAERNGLTMAELGEDVVRKLKSMLPPTGTSPANPIDVGLSASFDLRLYQEALDIILDDPGVDAIVMLGGGASTEMSAEYIQGLIASKERSDKHVLAIAYPGFVQIDQEDLLKPLHEHGIPVYPTPERALKAYARMIDYYQYQAGSGKKTNLFLKR
ncbi:MAG: acetate--CoA ligase family protein [Desulfomonilia bacterium]